MNWYNENDPKAAAWLRELIRMNLIAPGIVDERSIADVKPDELKDYRQCHFFAGIGGWSLALRLAGWPDDEPVDTGSCPCQPFSVAGQGRGKRDPRHLWPEFRRCIAGRRPAVLFGEQVASKAGRNWFSGVRADLEALGYETGAADLCAAGTSAPHIRQRLFWVAESGSQPAGRMLCGSLEGDCEDSIGASNQSGGSGISGRVAESAGVEWIIGGAESRGDAQAEHSDVAKPGAIGGVANGAGERWIGRTGPAESGGRGVIEIGGATGGAGAVGAAQRGAECAGAWGDYLIIPCADGKARRIERGSFPLVDGLPLGMVRCGDPDAPINAQACAEGRLMRLRGYGNAIVPELAAEFIIAYLEARL